MLKNKTAKLIRDVMNFKPTRAAYVTVINHLGKEITIRANELFADKPLLSSLTLDDANRIAFLAAFELMAG